MHPIVEEHRAEVEALCREYRVRRLDVFGSAVRGGFDALTRATSISSSSFTRPPR